MSGIISSFQRKEIKFFLTSAQRAALMPILLEHMQVDAYGEHTISNVFFDTDRYEITRASIEKPVYKEKLRVRSYGTPDPETGKVFIELKKKFQGIVYKRRIHLPVPEARAFLLEGVLPTDTDPQITREIARFMELHHPMPKVFLCYDRIALFDREDPDLRITFDQNLLWRTEDVSLCSGAWGTPIFPDDRSLMEVKIPGAMPLWLAHAMSGLGIHRSSFSKIGTCYQQFILPQQFPVTLHPAPAPVSAKYVKKVVNVHV